MECDEQETATFWKYEVITDVQSGIKLLNKAAKHDVSRNLKLT